MNASLKKENNAFNFIRLVCCLIVMYEHYVILTGVSFPLLDLRTTAVCVFFIFSGFWITSSYLNSASLKQFYIKRIKKIVPIYYSVVVVTLIVGSFFYTGNVKNYFLSSGTVKYLVAHFSFLNFLCHRLPGGVFNSQPINGSVWTLKIEVGFYLLIPILFYIIRKVQKNRRAFLAGCYFVFAFSGYLIKILVEKFNLNSSLDNQLPRYMSYFWAGLIIYLYFEAFYNSIHKYQYFVLALAVIVIGRYVPVVKHLVEPAALAYFSIGISLLLTGFSKINEKDISYPAYLIHYPLIMILNHVGLVSRNPIIMLLVTVVIVCIISKLIIFLTEKFRRR